MPVKWPKPPTPGGLPVEDPFIRQVFGADIPADVAGDPSWVLLAKTHPQEFVARMARMKGDESRDTNLAAQIDSSMGPDLLLQLRREELNTAQPRDEILAAIRAALGND
jgi:hypothetical protein